MRCSTIDDMVGRQLFFKCEIFQKRYCSSGPVHLMSHARVPGLEGDHRLACSGAFKFRGAMNAIMSLPPEQAAHGVVVHSSGNHAGAIALAAKLRGIPAYIVLPTDVPQARSLACLQYSLLNYQSNSLLVQRSKSGCVW